MGMGKVGGTSRAISVSGNPSAVSTTAAYMAPEAPSDGTIRAALMASVVDLTAVAVVAAAVALEGEES